MHGAQVKDVKEDVSNGVAKMRFTIDADISFTVGPEHPFEVTGVNAEAAMEPGAVALDRPINFTSVPEAEAWAQKMQMILAHAALRYVTAQQENLLKKAGHGPVMQVVQVDVPRGPVN